MNNTVKVTASTELLPLADAIARSVRRGQGITLEVTGIAAVNLAVKAIALAHNYLAFDGLEVCFVASFLDPEKVGAATPAMHLYVNRPERQFLSARQLPASEPPAENEGRADEQ